jgi:hypothetical protein
VVRDHNGQALAYVYYEEEPGKRSELLTKNEARRIATNTAKLPELLRRRQAGEPLKNENRVASRSFGSR